MKLIDADIFIYAVGRPHRYRQPCRALLERLEEEGIEGNIDVELLQEILGFFWRQRRLEDGLSLFDHLQRAFPDPVPIDNDVIVASRHLLARYPRIGPRDAIHAAVVLVHGMEGIVSTDRGFDRVREITRLDPMDL